MNFDLFVAWAIAKLPFKAVAQIVFLEGFRALLLLNVRRLGDCVGLAVVDVANNILLCILFSVFLIYIRLGRIRE